MDIEQVPVAVSVVYYLTNNHLKRLHILADHSKRE